VAAAGARRVAVSQAICQAPNPRGVTESLLKELTREKTLALDSESR
jgi:thiamine monophosphate synthase